MSGLRTILVLLAILSAGPIWAGDPAPVPPPTAEAAAAAVLAARERAATSELESLARRDDPDPWVVTDLLLAQGQREAALAFAAAAPRPDTASLPAYAGAWAAAPGDPSRRASLAAALRELGSGRHEAALSALAPPTSPGPRAPAADVLGLRLLRLQGDALVGLGRVDESLLVLRHVADGSEALGWLACAGAALAQMAQVYYAKPDRLAALEVAERASLLEERRGDSRAQSSMLNLVGMMCNETGQQERALEAYGRALGLQQQMGDLRGEGWTRLRMGNAEVARRRLKEGCAWMLSGRDVLERVGDRRGVAFATRGLANALGQAGRREEARVQYEAAAAALHALGDVTGEAQVLSDLGVLENEAGRQQEALVAYGRALGLLKEPADLPSIGVTRMRMGNALRALGDAWAAVAAYREASAALRVQGQEAMLGLTLCNWADLCREQGRFEEALGLLGEARQLARVAGDRETQASIEAALGAVHNERGDQPRALEHYRSALELFGSSGPPHLLAMLRQRFARVHMMQGDWARARAEADAAQAAFEAGGHAGLAVHVRLLLIELTRLEGRPQEALEAAEQAGARAEALGEVALQARLLAAQAIALNELGDQVEAERRYRASQGVLEAAGMRADVEVTRLNLANVRRACGDNEGALDLGTQALAGLEALGMLEKVALAANNLADQWRVQGQYARALGLAERAERLYAELGHPQGRAWALSTRGAIYNEIGDQEAAYACYLEAVDLLAALGDRRTLGQTLQRLANVHLARGELDDAERALAQARAEHESVGDARGAALVGASEAALAGSRGDAQAMLAHARRTRAEAARLGDLWLERTALSLVGEALADLGRLEESRATLDEALEQLAAQDERRGMAIVLEERAQVAERQGQLAQALEDARTAVLLTNALAEGLATTEASGAREKFGDVYEVGIRCALAGGDLEGMAWFLEQSRAGTLRQSLGSGAALEGAVVSATARAELVARRAEERRTLEAWRRASRTGSKTEVHGAQAAYQQAQTDVSAVLARIEREERGAASLSLGAVDGLSVLRSHLGEGEALVLYALAGSQALALVLDRDQARAVALGPSEAIVGDAEALVEAIHRRDGEEQIQAAARSLHERTIAPLGLPSSVRRLLVSPVGELGFVPYAMLGGALDIVLTPSGTVHGLLAGTQQARGRGVLALGDPVYEVGAPGSAPDEGQRAGTRLKLERLPASAQEARAVGTDPFSTVLLRERASESLLMSTLAARPRWRAIHLACHGLVDPERAMFSALALTPDAEQDGFLTALEVLRLEAPTDLVVLSACNTGRGRAYKTEGIVGLTRAFLHAGASRVLCSLWKVDDAATSALMRRFYELWNPRDGSDGLPAARALREAQAHVRSQPGWDHPSYWAAWVLWGLP